MLFGIGVSPLTTPTPRRELRCLVEASAPLSSTIVGGFSVVRGAFAFGLAAGVTAGTNGDSGNLLVSAFFGVFAFFASSSGKVAALSLDSFFICGGGFSSSFFVMMGSGALAVNFSNTFLVTASVAAGFGSGIEAAAGAAIGAGFVVERVGIDTAAAAEVFIASTEGIAGTGEGNFSFFCVPTATVAARFFVTLVCFLEAGAKVGDCGDFGIGTATGCCALGDETETGLLITGLATVRVGDGDEVGGGGELLSPSKPNNLSVKGASRTRRDGCCVIVGAAEGETGVGMVDFSTTGLLVAAAAADVPFAFPFRAAGEGGTYPVGGAE